MQTGQKIYYTGDMANQRGWFTVSREFGGQIDLAEVGGENRKIFGLWKNSIGTVYKGHCGTRFVTEEAYNKYRNDAIAGYEKFAARFVPMGNPHVDERDCAWPSDDADY